MGICREKHGASLLFRCTLCEYGGHNHIMKHLETVQTARAKLEKIE